MLELNVHLFYFIEDSKIEDSGPDLAAFSRENRGEKKSESTPDFQKKVRKYIKNKGLSKKDFIL